MRLKTVVADMADDAGVLEIAEHVAEQRVFVEVVEAAGVAAEPETADIGAGPQVKIDRAASRVIAEHRR